MDLKPLSIRIAVTLAALLTFISCISHADVLVSHALAMHGDAKYPQDFTGFDYTSPDAVKGGDIRRHSLGTFDSLNGFVAKGNAADSLGLIYDSLTVGSADEPFTQYGLVAKHMEYPADRSWIIFELNPEARFHDNTQVQAQDIVFTFNLLMEKGDPSYRFYYADVEKVEALSENRVRFQFKPGSSKELALTVGTMPILPKHYWLSRDFERSTLEKPLSSGPYRIGKVDAGRSITYERVDNYWAADHPARRGMFNFDRITIDYYRDEVAALEALKAGEYDVRLERMSKLWATAYEGELVKSGKIKTAEITHENPTGMQAYIFNTRRDVFKNRQLRHAISLAFDFEWTNQNLFYGAYTRTQSFYSNSELASQGLPSKEELALLNPFKEQLPSEVFTNTFELPKSNGKDRNRSNLRQAKKILDAANFKVVDNQLIDPTNGNPVTFEILLYDSGFKRITNPFIQGLKKLGIQASVRMVDTSQYINRMRSFDFDMMVHVFSQSLSPGNEQKEMWHSSAAMTNSSRNLIGIEHPAIDTLVQTIIEADKREELVTATRALDRVLLNQHYVVPHWHINHHRVAYWDKFNRPQTNPKYDSAYNVGLNTWWSKAAVLEAKADTKNETSAEITAKTSMQETSSTVGVN